MKKNKRIFLKSFGLGFLSLPFLRGVRANYKPRVVILGGGFGGGTCLRYFENFSEEIEIILIEKNKYYYTCPFSNYVLGGFRNISQNRFQYKSIDRNRIKIIYDEVKFIDSEKKKLKLHNYDYIKYDWLIISPGISFKTNQIEGYNPKTNLEHPHGWSGKQADIILKKINSLENNSKIIISAPEYPYRCPPAPYERASLIAYNLKKKGLEFKIIILDNKDSFTKKELFFEAWKELYSNNIEWISKKSGGKIIKLDSKKKFVVTENGEKISGDLINIIPEQKASDIFFSSNLIKNDWCDVNPTTFELKGNKFIHVIGDSINAWDMPKSAFSANSQGKACSENIINMILDRKVSNPVFLNTCYSLASPNHGFSVTSWYRVNSTNTKIVSLGSKQTSLGLSDSEKKEEVLQSLGWYEHITNDLFG